jgi:hypothetical protein
LSPPNTNKKERGKKHTDNTGNNINQIITTDQKNERQQN